jgi:uncharacterized protein
MDWKLVLLAPIVCFSYMVAATAGVGAAVIALTIAVHFYPLDYLVPVIVPLNLTAYSYLAIRHRSGIDREVLLKRILPLALLGMPLGLWLYYTIETGSLKMAFGTFIFIVSTFELIRTARNGANPVMRPIKTPATIFWLLGGGIIQGLWVSGGVMIAYWAGRSIPTKRVFRSTLATVWMTLNIVLLVSHLFAGSINANTGIVSAMLLPFVIAGIALGEWVHGRLSEYRFKMFVYAILFFAGGSIILRSWAG